MKELFREQDIIKVTFYQQLLEAASIPTIIRNQDLAGSGLTEIPIPEFFPALCVIHDQDYEEASVIIRNHLAANAQAVTTEVTCPGCGEPNPGNFDLCWSCGADLS